MTVTNCPRCAGCLWDDTLGLAPYHCLNCGERYTSGMTLIRRTPTEEEQSKKRRFAYAKLDRR